MNPTATLTHVLYVAAGHAAQPLTRLQRQFAAIGLHVSAGASEGIFALVFFAAVALVIFVVLRHRRSTAV